MKGKVKTSRFFVFELFLSKKMYCFAFQKCTDMKTLEKKDLQQDSEKLKQSDEPKAKKIKADPLESNSPVKTKQTNNLVLLIHHNVHFLDCLLQSYWCFSLRL